MLQIPSTLILVLSLKHHPPSWVLPTDQAHVPPMSGSAWSGADCCGLGSTAAPFIQDLELFFLAVMILPVGFGQPSNSLTSGKSQMSLHRPLSPFLQNLHLRSGCGGLSFATLPLKKIVIRNKFYYFTHY